jgi:hypothetical protein
MNARQRVVVLNSRLATIAVFTVTDAEWSFVGDACRRQLMVESGHVSDAQVPVKMSKKGG